MPTAGKGSLSLRVSEELAPVVQRAVGAHPQIAGNLGSRFVAALHQLHRFQFELFGKRALRLLHRLVPLWRTSTSSSLPSPFSRVKTRHVIEICSILWQNHARHASERRRHDMLHKEDSSREKEFSHQSSWPVKRAHNLNGSSLVPFPRLYREKPLIIHVSF